MIFKVKEEAQQFLIEIGKIHEITKVADKDYNPTEEEISSFIKSRGSIIPKLKSFRKSQDGKQNWRKNRNSMMAGIKKWHSSTDGKKFHRSLGRYNATRDSRAREKNQEESYLNGLVEALKGLSSLITHMYIELDFYHPIEEQIELEMLLEETHPVIRRIEESILKLKSALDEDLDFLLRLIEPKSLIIELSQEYNKPIEEVKEIFEANLGLSQDSYLLAFERTRDELCS